MGAGRAVSPPDLDTILEQALAWGYDATKPQEDTVEVRLGAGERLQFVALPDDDFLIGFADTAWHTHLPAYLEGCDGSTAGYDCYELLAAAAVGDLIVIDLFEAGALSDRWLQHRSGSLTSDYPQAGEELRVRTATPKS